MKKYHKLNYDLIIKIQDWIMKNENIIASPIKNNTLLVKDEVTCMYFYVYICVIHLYY